MSTVLIENIVTRDCLDDALAALQATCCQPLPTAGDSGAGSVPVAGPLVISGAGNITTSASGNTITVMGASSALIDNGDGTYSFMPGDGSAPTEILTSTLTINADGSYTFTGADGSTVVIPADCCPTMTDNGDGTFTFTAGDGSTVIFATHPATTATSNAAPFSWNAATQTLNVPQSPTLVTNADGSHTFNSGDGSAPVVIPADCCPTLTANADGSFTFTAGDGSTVTIPALPLDVQLANAVIDTTTNEMVLTLNDGTEYRVPLSALLPVVADGVTVVGDGTVGDPLSAGYFVDNGDGTYTWNGADGSNFTIPADCCPTLADNGDGTFTFTDGGGNTVTFATHPATAVTSTAAPFSWNAATQTLNVPQAPTLVANGDGSHTFTAGDGSAPVIIPADCCPTLVDNGDGTYTFTAGDGSTTTITVHPTAALTNNAAPFSWNAAVQTGNIPQVPSIALTATGFTFTPGDGGSVVNYVEPVDEDTYVTGFSISGNVAAITLNNGTTFTQTIPTTIDINVQSFALAGTDLILTETDGTVHTVSLPQEIKVSAVSYVPSTGILTVTNSDGTSVSATVSTVDINVVTALDGILVPATTVEDALQQIDDWTKRVINPGASTPIAPVADAGARALLNSGQFQVAETNEIIPKIGADGVARWELRKLSAYKSFKSVLDFPPAVRTVIPYNIDIDDPNGYIVNGVFTAPIDGLYLPYANIMLSPKIAAPSNYSNWNLWQMLNGAIYNLVDVRTDLGTNAGVDPTVSTTSRSFVLSGGSPVRMNAGDKLSFAVSPANSAAMFTANTSGFANTMSVTYIQ